VVCLGVKIRDKLLLKIGVKRIRKMGESREEGMCFRNVTIQRRVRGRGGGKNLREGRLGGEGISGRRKTRGGAVL